jgi:hypothetical protein
VACCEVAVACRGASAIGGWCVSIGRAVRLGVPYPASGIPRWLALVWLAAVLNDWRCIKLVVYQSFFGAAATTCPRELTVVVATMTDPA